MAAQKDPCAQKDFDTRAATGCNDDQFLRDWGFEIYERPRYGPPVWRRKSDGRLFSAEDAHRAAEFMRRRGLEKLPST